MDNRYLPLIPRGRAGQKHVTLFGPQLAARADDRFALHAYHHRITRRIGRMHDRNCAVFASFYHDYILYPTTGKGQLSKHGFDAVADLKIARLNEAKWRRVKAAGRSSGLPFWTTNMTGTHGCQSQNRPNLVDSG